MLFVLYLGADRHPQAKGPPHPTPPLPDLGVSKEQQGKTSAPGTGLGSHRGILVLHGHAWTQWLLWLGRGQPWGLRSSSTGSPGRSRMQRGSSSKSVLVAAAPKESICSWFPA